MTATLHLHGRDPDPPKPAGGPPRLWKASENLPRRTRRRRADGKYLLPSTRASLRTPTSARRSRESRQQQPAVTVHNLPPCGKEPARKEQLRAIASDPTCSEDARESARHDLFLE